MSASVVSGVPVLFAFEVLSKTCALWRPLLNTYLQIVYVDHPSACVVGKRDSGKNAPS